MPGQKLRFPPPAYRRHLILFLLLLTTGTLSATTTTTIIAAPPPPPHFHVPTPHGTLAYKVIEESRILFLKLMTRAHSSYIATTVGPVHVIRCAGKRGATLPPVVLVHGVCSTGK